jgi:hypothetical protein
MIFASVIKNILYMKKKVLSHVKEYVDTQTGEIKSIETSRVYSYSPKTTDEFYYTFIDFISPIFKVNSMNAKNLLVWMCSNMKYNTGEVSLTTAARKEVCDKCNISNSNLSRALK